jgi:uncharacterized membrane protein YjfL (UPF0719 family)
LDDHGAEHKKPTNTSRSFSPGILKNSTEANVNQTIAIISGFAELLLSIGLSIFVIYLSFGVFRRITGPMDEIGELKKNNAAAGIFVGSLLVSSAMIVRQAIYPTISTLQTKLFAGIDLLTGASLVALSLLYIGLATIVSVAAMALSIRIFLRLPRRVEVLAEIAKNNIAIAITLGSIILVMGLFLSQGIQSLLSAIIPDPAFGRIQIMGGPQ